MRIDKGQHTQTLENVRQEIMVMQKLENSVPSCEAAHLIDLVESETHIFCLMAPRGRYLLSDIIQENSFTDARGRIIFTIALIRSLARHIQKAHKNYVVLRHLNAAAISLR